MQSTTDLRKIRHDMSSGVAALQTAFSALTSGNPADAETAKQLFKLGLEKLKSIMADIDRSTRQAKQE